MAVRFAVLVAIVSAAAQAQAPAPVSPIHAPIAIRPKGGNAPAEMDKLKDLAGTWKCAGKGIAQEPLGLAERELTATFTIASDADGHWQSLRWEEDKTKSNPKPLRAAGNWGWEPVSKGFLATWFDNTGAGPRVASATGPVGAIWTWTGPLGYPDGRRAIARQTIEVQEKKLALTWEIEIVGGAKMAIWQAMSCTKAKK